MKCKEKKKKDTGVFANPRYTWLDIIWEYTNPTFLKLFSRFSKTFQGYILIFKVFHLKPLFSSFFSHFHDFQVFSRFKSRSQLCCSYKMHIFSCFLRRKYGYATFYGPVVACVAFNIFIFLRVAWSISRNQNMGTRVPVSDLERRKVRLNCCYTTYSSFDTTFTKFGYTWAI